MQKMVYLGALCDDMQEQSVSLPPEKVPVIREKVIRSLVSKSMFASDCHSLLGSFSICILMIKWDCEHLQSFQRGFLSQRRKKSSTQEIIITLGILWWWTRKENLLSHCHLVPTFWTMVTSNASWLGLGTHCKGRMVQGDCSSMH